MELLSLRGGKEALGDHAEFFLAECRNNLE